ncbi:MAG: hypothetical protein AAF513_04800 [Pseudomonadota bacterium]
MKLRTRGDTLRLRLTRTEVAALEGGATIAECTRFPDGNSLRYALVPGSRRHAELAAGEGGLEILIHVPHAEAQAWAGSDEVGFSGREPFTVGPLQVLIEKDFTCITPREGEEETDTYPNPNAVDA